MDKTKAEFIGVLFKLLGDLAWPVVVLIVVFTFRRQISSLVERTREFEAGPAKFKIDPAKVEKAREISEQVPSQEEAAKQLLEQALEDRELRILRGLIGEPAGRDLNIYKRSDYYRPALDSLALKNLVYQQGGKYFLTSLGTEVVKQYMKKELAKL